MSITKHACFEVVTQCQISDGIEIRNIYRKLGRLSPEIFQMEDLPIDLQRYPQHHSWH